MEEIDNIEGMSKMKRISLLTPSNNQGEIGNNVESIPYSDGYIRTYTIKRFLKEAKEKGGEVVIVPHKWNGKKFDRIVDCDNHGRLTLDDGRQVWPYKKIYNTF